MSSSLGLLRRLKRVWSFMARISEEIQCFEKHGGVFLVRVMIEMLLLSALLNITKTECRKT